MARVFRKFDANGDDRISRSELAALFESLGHAASNDELARMMAEVDVDGDGFISLDEFAALNATVVGDAAARLGGPAPRLSRLRRRRATAPSPSPSAVGEVGC